MTNAAADPAYQSVRAELEAQLLAVLRGADDPRLMEQPCRYEAEPYTTGWLEPENVSADVSWADAREHMEARRKAPPFPCCTSTATNV